MRFVKVAGVLFSLVVFGIGLWWIQEGGLNSDLGEGSDSQGVQRIEEGSISSELGASSARASFVGAHSSGAAYSESIRQRVVNANKPFDLPDPPAMRSPTGEKDVLQCAPSDSHCDAFSPLFASSWDEAQWMRRHGFVDAAQQLAAAEWSESELDLRIKAGDPVAVAELAKRFLSKSEELEAKEVLMDGVRNGNIYAAHQLAAIDEGRTLPFYKRPGLEWLLVARRLGDAQVGMTYIMSRYPNLQPSEIDHAMLVADRRIEQFRLNGRTVERRPERP